MEPMSGDQGLESDRVTIPFNEDQSTLVNSDNAWTVPLQSLPRSNREQNPKLIVTFNTKVEVHALKLQGSTDAAEDITFILSYWDEESRQFQDLLDSSGEPQVSGVEISRRFRYTAT